MGIWNSLSRMGSIGFDEIEDELRKRGLSLQDIASQTGDVNAPTTGGIALLGANPAIENAIPNTPAANPHLRRMASPGGGFERFEKFAKSPAPAPIDWSGEATRGEDVDGTGGFDDSPARTPRRSEISGEQLRMASDLPANTIKAKKKGWWRRLAAGVGDNLRSGGDWFTAATQGVSEAIDPDQRAERIKQRNLAKMFGQHQMNVGLEGAEQKRLETESEITKRYNDVLVDQANARTNAQKVVNDTQKAERDLLVKTAYDVLDEFDPNAPDNAGLVGRMKAAGVPVVHKKKGEKFQSVQTPNGDLKVFNPATGEYIDKGNFSKPPTIASNELKDSLFPSLRTKEQIDAEVEASVGPLPEGRRIRPEVQQSILNIQSTDEAGNAIFPYRNADGSIDEAKLISDIAANRRSVQGLTLSQVYENLPSNYGQRKAQTMRKALEGNRPTQEAVDQFRTAISNHAPSANAVALPITTIVEGFNRVLNIKNPKQRAKALKAYYTDILPNIKVGR